MSEIKDMRGHVVSVGDQVVYNGPGHYKDLSLGVVTGFTPKMIRVSTHKRPIDPGLLVVVSKFPIKLIVLDAVDLCGPPS